jgi:hypothetical protein
MHGLHGNPISTFFVKEVKWNKTRYLFSSLQKIYERNTPHPKTVTLLLAFNKDGGKPKKTINGPIAGTNLLEEYTAISCRLDLARKLKTQA